MKCLLYIFLPLLLFLRNESPAGSGAVYILLYHSFTGDKTYPTDVSLFELNNHIQTLKNNGFTFVSFNDMMNGNVKGRKNILLMVDDGNRSSYLAYKRILKVNNIKPVYAIYPGIINKQFRAMTWEMVRELSNEGCEIASHGYYHLQLTKELYLKNKRSFEREVYLSKKTIEKNIRKEVWVFTYPYGIFSPFVKNEIKNAGYSFAFTLHWKPVIIPVSMSNDPFMLGRYMLNRNWKKIYRSIREDLKKAPGNKQSLLTKGPEGQ